MVSCHDLVGWNLWDNWLEWVRYGIAHSSVNSLEIIKYAMTCCVSTIQWHLAKIDENNPSQEDMAVLQGRLHTFMGICREMLSSNDGLEQEVSLIFVFL